MECKMTFFFQFQRKELGFILLISKNMSELLIPRRAVIVWDGLIGYVDPSSLFTCTQLFGKRAC